MDTFQSVADSRFDSSNGWTLVASSKRYRKQKRAANSGVSGMIFPNERSIPADLEDELNGAGAARSKLQSNCYRYNDEIAARDGNLKKEEKEKEKEKEEEEEKEKEKEMEKGEMEREMEMEMEMEKEKEKEKEKKKKKKQVKTIWWKVKEKESLAEGAAKIDFECLNITLNHISAPHRRKPEWIRLLRFVEWFGISLSDVQFSWPEMFKDPRLFKLIDVIDVPFSYIPQLIYKRSSDWINEQPLGALRGFVWWAFNMTMDFSTALRTPRISQVGIFVTLAMVLRSNPRSLYSQLPVMRTEGRHQGLYTLPVTVWMIAQASQGNLLVGLSTWGHNLLPEVGTNPHSRDLILQLVEKILSDPNARTKLLADGADRMDHGSTIPPSSFENLLRLTFPAPSARVKATARFEAIYPLLKEVALAGAPGSKTMKRVTRQMFTFSLKFAQEGNPVLAKEATEIAIWSVTENVFCCKLWDNLYEENLKASVALLKKLVDEWEDHSLKISLRDAFILRLTMKSFRLKNEKGIAEGGASGSLYEEADKSCKVILGRISFGSGSLLKEVALAGAPGSKTMKRVTRHMFTFSLKFAQEGNPVLAKEATEIAIWSVTENVDCCKLWDNLYEENLKRSVALLKKLVDEWEDHSLKLSSSPRDALTLKRTMKSFRLKNKKAITEGGASGSLYEEADKSCKVILGRLSRGSGFLNGTAVAAAVLAASAFVLSYNAEATTMLNKLLDSLEVHLY